MSSDYTNVTDGTPTKPDYTPTDPDDNYTADLQFANVFWQWSKGEWYQQSCPPGLTFNSRLNLCDWPRDANNDAPFVLNDPSLDKNAP
ncbi:MAG TPA: carbohydrate-binding module family 14 protein [Ktedonosporobacter sp.]|nr:carbohydrate-binding module family 14 protein [Ktedonosporobacter sp.]